MSFSLRSWSNWKSPAELDMVTVTQMGCSEPRSRRTPSMAAADTEWIESDPAEKGIRDRPFAMSSASAMRTTPASSVRGFPPERCEMMAWRISARMSVA